MQQPAERAQQRGLAAAVAPAHMQQGAAGQREAEIGEQQAVAAAAAQVLDLEHLLVCAAADAHPLCGVVTEDEEGASRQRRREQSQLKAAAADAGFPTVSIKLQDGYELSAIRRSLIDAIETSEVRVKHDTPEPAEADEESLLADLAAAMQDPDSARGPERFVARADQQCEYRVRRPAPRPSKARTAPGLQAEPAAPYPTAAVQRWRPPPAVPAAPVSLMPCSEHLM
jgi:uncharacterized protein YicC (UPF0701 family)